MIRVRFNPVEIAYKTIDGKAVIELYGRADGKQVCVQVADFEPYFWALDEGEISDEKITRVEENRKSFLGKEVNAKKVFVRHPSDVPMVREKFKSLEADIPFTRRFLIDRRITPLLSYEAEGEVVKSDYKAEVIAASAIRYLSDDLPKLKILSVDIETHTQLGKEILPENDPVIMIAVYGEGLRKVMTWKHFDTKLDYVEVVGSEVELIERFGQIVEDYKPDAITGYFSDGFDMPYLKTRADKYKARLNIGLDKSQIRMKKGQTPVAEITGIAHIDIFKFIKRMFRTTFTSFRLNDMARELLNDSKGDVDLDELFSEWNSQNPDLERFAEYNMKDAELTYRLCVKLMPNLTELTKLIGLTPSELSRMSFSQLVEWYLIKEAPDFNELVPNKPGFSEERSRRIESYEGGFVYEPTPGLYKDVAVFDFMSLYPTIISSHNISPDTIEYGKDSVDGVLKGLSFAKERKGFISTVIENVINRRQRVKELARKTSEDKTLDARQLALKTIANSIYGYYGFFGARWYNIDCAKAITAYGRHHIQDVIGKAKDEGLKVIYSDTDSIFIALNGKKISEVADFVERINRSLPGIMGLEYEGLYTSGIFVATKGTETGAKKKYALMSESGKMKVRGFEAVRRNLSPIAKETQEKVLRMILSGETKENVADYIKEVIRTLRSKKVATEKVTIKTQITREVKSYENIPPHVAIAIKMQERGEKVGAGTTVSYIVTEGRSIIRDRAKLPEEVKAGEYDAEYYIANQVVPSVGKILDVIGYESRQLLEEREQSKLQSFFG